MMERMIQMLLGVLDMAKYSSITRLKAKNGSEMIFSSFKTDPEIECHH
jgi:hypothetical protein